jgi:hypothetical protein
MKRRVHRAAKPRSPGRARPKKADPGVSDGVGLGYRIIQEYMQQGERVARAFWNPGGDGVDRLDPSRLMDRALRSAQDLAGTFSEIVRVMANAPKEAPFAAGRPGGFDFGPAHRPGRANGKAAPANGASHGGGANVVPGANGSIAVEVDSRRPVAVSIALDDDAARSVLEVPPLPGPGSSRLRGIALAVAGQTGGMRLKVTVPPRVAAGTYAGPVLDARTGQPRGLITVRVTR